MSTMFWVWLTAAVVFLIMELMSPTFIFACFVAGSIVAGAFGYFYPESYYWQVGLFLIVTLALLPLTRTLAKKITKESPEKSNIDALIGKVALVTKAIDPDLGGQVKIGGEVWGAHAGEPISENEKVRVVSISGTKAHVERLLEEKE
jgi:membrane protein implicated in regulation of membrane protease activity